MQLAAAALSLMLLDPAHQPQTVTGTTWTGGLALEYSFGLTPRLSLDARRGYERHIDYFYSLYRPTNPPGNTRTIAWERRVVSRPWAASATYRFDPLGRWTPRVALGVRHVRAPLIDYQARAALLPASSVGTRYHDAYINRTSAQVTAGIDLRLTDRLALRADLQRLLRHDGVAYDPRTTGGLGVIWRARE